MNNISTKLKRMWWIPLLTGLICLGLGIWVFLAPLEAVPVLAIIFAICMLGAGLLNLTLGFNTRTGSPVWGWAVALGILEIIAGIWMLCLPAPQLEIAFIFIVGIMVLVGAVNAVAESFALASVSGWWAIWSVLLLIAVIGLAIVMFANPLSWSSTTVICLGCALVCFGAYRIGLSIALLSLSRRIH